MDETFELVHVEGRTFLFATLNQYVECQKLFMGLAQNNGCIIQKYYWTSILDPTIIEYIQPKITDIFRFHCDISGNMEDIQTLIQQYKEQRKSRIYLDQCLYSPLSTQEIKETALRLLQSI